jgi:CBS domain containing-hemolysin-like protein
MPLCGAPNQDDPMSIETLSWIGIAFCVSQSAIFSGLNLAFFSLSRLQLEVDAVTDDRAAKVLELRQDSNFLLTTILWGNVSINVLLTLLSNSVMAGLIAFLFSTVAITLFGEIAPQAYFSRNALRMASLLSPLIRLYQFVLYPVAKPSAKILDAWLGKEGITYLREEDLRAIIHKHIEADEAEVESLEGIGALNFLDIDDLNVTEEGELVIASSIIPLPVKVDFPLIPEISPNPQDPFLQSINRSGRTWVILTDETNGKPLLLLDADGLLRDVIFGPHETVDPYRYCHRPIIITDETTSLGDAIHTLKASESSDADHDGVIENDVLLVWGEQKRIITGADILGRLLKGVASVVEAAPEELDKSSESISDSAN